MTPSASPFRTIAAVNLSTFHLARAASLYFSQSTPWLLPSALDRQPVQPHQILHILTRAMLPCSFFPRYPLQRFQPLHSLLPVNSFRTEKADQESIDMPDRERRATTVVDRK